MVVRKRFTKLHSHCLLDIILYTQQHIKPMKIQNLIKTLHKPVHPVVSATAIIGIVLLIALSPFIQRALSRFNFSFTPPSKITYVHVTPLPNITAAPNVPTVTFNQHTFTSPDLGISFDFVDDNKSPIQVKEIGAKVYLNAGGEQPPAGKFVEVFSKNPSDSLEQAIQKAVMQGYSTQNCQIVSANPPTNYNSVNPTFQYARIEVTGSDTLGLGDREYKAQHDCPGKYTTVNATMYFTMDTQHPSKLLFFSLGQDNFGGRPQTSNEPFVTWDHTVRITGN